MCFPKIWPGAPLPTSHYLHHRLISLQRTRENTKQNKTAKQDSGRFCKELFKCGGSKEEKKNYSRTVRSREHEAFGWSRQCSVWLSIWWFAPPWRLTLTMDVTYVWCLWGNTRGGLSNPSNMQSSEVTTFYDSRALRVFLLLIIRKLFRAHCQE